MTQQHDYKAALELMYISRKATGHGESDSFIGFKDWDANVHIEAIKSALKIAENKELRAKAPQWQPIETAPKDGRNLWVWDGKQQYVAWHGHDWNMDPDEKKDPEWLCGDGDDFSCGYYYLPCDPTHWMPLPTPPEGEG